MIVQTCAVKHVNSGPRESRQCEKSVVPKPDSEAISICLHFFERSCYVVQQYSIAHTLTTVQPSFNRRVSFWLGHHMQMFSLNKVRTFAAVNRAKKKQKAEDMLGQRAADCSSLTHNILYSLWGGCPGNPGHRGCSTQYRIVKRASVHVYMYLPHITTTCASLIIQSPRVQIIMVDLHTLFTQ